jgi:hypothetical protein
MTEQLKSFTAQELAVGLISHLQANNTRFLRPETAKALITALAADIKEKESLVFPPIQTTLPERKKDDPFF